MSRFSKHQQENIMFPVGGTFLINWIAFEVLLGRTKPFAPLTCPLPRHRSTDVCLLYKKSSHTHRVNYIPARFITPSQKRELPEASHAWLPAKGQRGARRRANWQRTHEHVTAAEKLVPVCPSIRLTVVWFVLVLLLLLLLLLPCHLIATAPKFLVSIRELLSLIGFQRDSSRWRNFCTFASCLTLLLRVPAGRWLLHAFVTSFPRGPRGGPIDRSAAVRDRCHTVRTGLPWEAVLLHKYRPDIVGSVGMLSILPRGQIWAFRVAQWVC